MATKKFAGPSPYNLNQPGPPDVDILFKEYMQNVAADVSVRERKDPVIGAVFGLGRAGAIHMANLNRNPRIHIKYIVDDHEHRFDELKIFWSLSEDVTFLTPNESDRVYSDNSVNTAFIFTPTKTHYEIITQCLTNGMDVFCEKPITETVEESKQCYELAQAKGRTLFAAFMRRFEPSYIDLKKRIRKGEIGHIQVVKGTTRDSPLPPIEYIKTSGGIFFDLTVHDIDLTLWLLGEVPTSVRVSASAILDEYKAVDDYDTVATVLTFPSGTIALIDTSRCSCYGFDQRIELYGNKGMIKVDNPRPLHSTEYVVGLEGVKYNPIYYSFPSRHHIAYKIELENFLDVVQYDAPLEVKSWQVLAVSKVVKAAEKSARTGETVHIDWSTDDIPEEYS
ncbi:inositol 2-dehydrogenase-like [Leptidea sinapis]|uniref:inositol 2-dehydrogenase-like n=1 Tax=Leptidea sinapis TaxID=189913 RepID=UPI00213044B6|nr:inositol 2-dehydrogenase-like [Leptidea sinapis]